MSEQPDINAIIYPGNLKKDYIVGKYDVPEQPERTLDQEQGMGSDFSA